MQNETTRFEQSGNGGAPPPTANPFAVAVPKQSMMEVAQSREVAEVQAGMLIAQRFPRNEVLAMDRILQAFTRPTLAEQAMYTYARGGSDITGPSIRAAEAIAQNWGHIHFGVRELYQANGESAVEAFAWDVQTGSRDSKVFQVPHFRDTKRGRYKLEDARDIYELVANVGARRKRACILSVIPGDVVEQAMKQAELTLHTKAEVTPERLKGIVEKFGEFSITQAQIEKRIQRRLEALTPALMVQLGKILNSLRDGMSAPTDWFEVVASGDASAATSAVDRVKAAVKAGKKPEAATEQQPPVPGASFDKSPSTEAAKQEATPAAAPGQISFAKLVDRLQKATDLDVLDADADLIKSLPADQQSDATTIYRARRGELEA